MTARALLEWFYDDLGDLVADYSDGPEPADFFAKAQVTAQIAAMGPNGRGMLACYHRRMIRQMSMADLAYKVAVWNWHEVAARADMLAKGEPRRPWFGYSARLCRDLGRPGECRPSNWPKDSNSAGCWTGDNVRLWGPD